MIETERFHVLGVYQFHCLLSDVRISICKKLYCSFFFLGRGGEEEDIRNTWFFVFFLCQLLTNEPRDLEVNGGLSRNQIFIQSSMLILGMSIKAYLAVPHQFIYVVLLGMFIRFSQHFFMLNPPLLTAALWIEVLFVEMLMIFELFIKIICRFCKTAESEYELRYVCSFVCSLCLFVCLFVMSVRLCVRYVCSFVCPHGKSRFPQDR